jgi:hypothetical protein
VLITVSITVETRSQGSGREQVQHVEDGRSRGRCASPRGKAEPHSSSPSSCLNQNVPSLALHSLAEARPARGKGFVPAWLAKFTPGSWCESI